jgi:hypothetical protein
MNTGDARRILAGVLLCGALCAAAETRVLAEWNFDRADRKPWAANRSSNVRVEGGILTGEIAG